ncbi:MAG: ABC transporter permease [Fervidicoccaceae archaeon]|jgi:peptide/nickel transport system permease protein|nr:ABC transporter permease [Fervidicoccaceae archaeon]
MRVRKLIARRIALMIFVLWGIITITFIVARVIPADPIGSILGPQAPPELVEKLRKEWGLDKPLYQQYFDYIINVLHGDFGKSIKTNRPVLEDLKQFFPATIELATFSLIIAVLIGVPLGILSALKKDSTIDYLSRMFALTGVSTPVFWLGLVLLYLFYYKIQIFPEPGRLSVGVQPPDPITGMILLDSLLRGKFDVFLDALKHIILPSIVLGFYNSAYIMRITRASVLEVVSQEYVRMAIAKGLRRRKVILKHVFRNAMIPVVTVIGITYGSLLEGAVLTETIFAWPGLGRYATQAFLSLDYNAVVGATFLIALVYSLVNLVVDVLYIYIDPRTRGALEG